MSLSLFTRYKRTMISFLACWCCCSLSLLAQQKNYTVANAHAHNDYEHPIPFYTAYNAGFGSIEADIFLVNKQLYVAHNLKDIDSVRTLQSLYLNPLQQAIKKNKGYAYADKSKKLILLVDLKTEAEPTLQALLQFLQKYKTITSCPTLKIVMTGNQPDVSKLLSYPSFIFFDGNLSKSYTDKELKRVALFSDNFRNYSKWNGDSTLTKDDREKLESAISKAHGLNKPIRFWGGPDSPNAWQEFMRLKADYLNTDKIEEISTFLKTRSGK